MPELVPLGSILRRIERFERRDPNTTYKFAGTYSYGRGIFVAQRRKGSDFNLDYVQRIRAGDFVYCKIMAWEGAFGVVPPEADNCVMSGAFVCYKPDVNLVLPEYLAYYFRLENNWRRIGGASKGTNVRRKSLHPQAFEGSTIPLVSLNEQRKVVTRLRHFDTLIQEITALRLRADESLSALSRSILMNSEWVRTPMRELVTPRPPNVTVDRSKSYTFAGVFSFGRGVFRGATKSGIDFAYDRLTRVHFGDFIYPKLMAWEGALGIVPEDCDGLVVSPEFPVFTVNTDRVLPETLDTYFRSPFIWPELAGTSKGTNVRRRRLHPTAFLGFEMHLPPMSTQSKLRRIRKASNDIQWIRKATAIAIESLLPSILEKTFAITL
jgi:type I restriction enzyme, S subunit